MSEEYLNKSGLAYFWSKLKAWCSSIFVTKATDETITGQKTFYKFLIVKRDDYERGVSTTDLDGRMLDFRDSHDVNMGAVCCVIQADKSSNTCLYAYDTTVPSGVNIGSLSIGCDSSGNVRTHAPTPSASAPSDSIATVGWVNAAPGVVHTTGAETINGTKSFTTRIRLGNADTATVEGGEILLEAPALGSQYNGIILDTRGGKFRIFGEPSADGTSKTGVGAILEIDPYSSIISSVYYTYHVNGIKHISTEYSRGVTATEIWRDLYDLKDINGTRFANFSNVTRADKSSMTCIFAFDTTATDGANIGYIGIGCDANGNVVTNAPTPAASDNSSQIATTKFVKDQGYGNPVGTIIWYAGSGTPSGYSICDGGAISRTTYAALFAVIGTTYGAGNGSTTFNKPNLINRFIQGSGTSGTVKSAGLPNITGYDTMSWNTVHSGIVNNVASNRSGCFSSDRTIVSGWCPPNGHYGTDSTEARRGVKFDASLSNSIYGNSTTVQPPALTLRPMIKL